MTYYSMRYYHTYNASLISLTNIAGIENAITIDSLLVLGGGKQLVVCSLVRQSTLSNETLLQGIGGAPNPGMAASSSRKGVRRGGTIANMSAEKIQVCMYVCV